MALQNKVKYNLAQLLGRLIPDSGNAQTICVATMDTTDPANIINLNYTNILFANTTPRELWSSIITESEKQNLLSQLLEACTTQYPGETNLNSFYGEIKDGFEKRVQKIAAAIRNNDCVLFMGPELLQCLRGNETEAFNAYFARELATRLGNAGIYFDNDFIDSISYIANRYEDLPKTVNRELGVEAIKSFANAMIYRTVFEKIAQLKFPLVISTNPDDILEKEYEKQNIPCQTGFYDMSNKSMSKTDFNETDKIIYKIFGSFENPYSLLFTDNDRVQFSKNVVKNTPPIPALIKVLLENKYCIFLGFNFHEWHLKILIDCLGLTKKEGQTYALLMDNVSESSVEHFEKNYKFYFINEEIEKFLNEVSKALNS